MHGKSTNSRLTVVGNRSVVVTSSKHRSLIPFYSRRRIAIAAFAAPTSLPSPLREEGSSGIGENETSLLKPLPKRVESPADDPRLHNPLQRMERLGTGWMGVVMELDGVCVDYEYGDVSTRAWQQLSEEEGKSMPPMWALRKADGMKNEQVCPNPGMTV